MVLKKMKHMKKILAFVLAVGLAVPTVPGWKEPVRAEAAAAEETTAVTYESVRAAAKAKESTLEGFDLDLSGHTFTNADSELNYSADNTNADQKYLNVLNHLREGDDDQTIIIRFKASTNGLLFGFGTSTASTDGTNKDNMLFRISDEPQEKRTGKLRIGLVADRKNTSDAEFIAGTFEDGAVLNNNEVHTMAITFRQSASYSRDNVHLVIDGQTDLIAKFDWGDRWISGITKARNPYTKMYIGGSGKYGSGTALNGKVYAVTVLNEAYSVEQLQEITTRRVTLENVRAAAKMNYENAADNMRKAFDIDVSDEMFAGSTYVDYSTDTADRKYIDTLENLRAGTDDQSLIFRFRTTHAGVVFGMGAANTNDNGQNMCVQVTDAGKLRFTFRSTKADGSVGGMRAEFAPDNEKIPNFKDGKWHTVAFSFLTSIDRAENNVRLVVDGLGERWQQQHWSAWKIGFNQGTGKYNHCSIGGGAGADASVGANFNGDIDFVTVINEAYSVEELQTITRRTEELSEFDTTLSGVRAEARSIYENSKLAFDLDLSKEVFDGTNTLDYSTDTADRKCLEVLNNYLSADVAEEDKKAQTVIVRFRADAQGTLLGMGSNAGGAGDDGNDLVIGINSSGELRVALRHLKADGSEGGGLRGGFSGSLKNGEWHTLAVCMDPSKGCANNNGNVRIVLDGGNDLWVTSWCGGYRAGLNLRPDNGFTKFRIGGSYTNDNFKHGTTPFDGDIESVTVINKAYSLSQLQKITAVDKDKKDSYAPMSAAGTKNTWLFTGAAEAVADFQSSKTTRNFVGLFEDSLRTAGTYVEKSRFVFNTANREADVASVLADYDEMIGKYGTQAVGIVVGASDYSKGYEGIPEFKKNLKALLEKIYAEGKLPFVITPPPSANAGDAALVEKYMAMIKAVAENKARVANISGLAASNLTDGKLNPAGHQAVSNAIKTALGAGTATSYAFDLNGGTYTIAKKSDLDADAGLVTVTSGADSIQVSVQADSISGTTAQLEYILKDEAGQEITSPVPEGETTFTVDGLKAGAVYTLSVWDASRENVRESYRPVTITVGEGATGTVGSYKDGNLATNEKIKALLTSEEPVTYLFMGDSITHGIVTQGYDNVPQMFAKYLDEIGRKNDVVLNTGVSNATLATTNAQIDHRLKQFDPDVVMIMLGTNDSSTQGENTVNANGSGATASITAEEFKNRYKTLIQHIHENNADTSIVLRVPCEMIKDAAHDGYEEKFAAIKTAAEEMRAEIAGLNIVVVDHRAEWLRYQAEVRNDNIKNGTTYGWLNDAVHPNGRGNISMFQQIIRELGLYQNTSELANYAYELDDWTGTSDMEIPVVIQETQGEISMADLAGYTNELKNVTLTLTDENGRSVSKTAVYAENGTLAVTGVDGYEKTYTAEVTGKDKTDSKEIHFRAVVQGYTVEAALTTDSAKMGKVSVSALDSDENAEKKTVMNVPYGSGMGARFEAKAYEGYKFVGWYTDEAGTEEAEVVNAEATNKIQSVRHNEKLYAKFDKKTEHMFKTKILTKERDNVYTLVDQRRDRYNTYITVTAPEAPVGQVFSHWVEEEKPDVVVSIDPEYQFGVMDDRNLVAIYVDNESEKAKQPTTARVESTFLIREDDGTAKVRFVAQLSIPEEYVLNETGLIWTGKSKAVKPDLNIDIVGNGAKQIIAPKINNSYQFSATVSKIPQYKTVRGVIYAKVTPKAGGAPQYIYSDEVAVQHTVISEDGEELTEPPVQ